MADDVLYSGLTDNLDAIVAAMRLMYYAHHEWPGWGSEVVERAVEVLRAGPELAEKLEQFANEAGMP
jgi:hypothetical protein